MVSPARWTPKRGDAMWIDLNPQAGSEQAGRRDLYVALMLPRSTAG